MVWLLLKENSVSSGLSEIKDIFYNVSRKFSQHTKPRGDLKPHHSAKLAPGSV